MVYMTMLLSIEKGERMSSAWLNLKQRQELQEWLKRPNGALVLKDPIHYCQAVFEAVEGGGVHVKTRRVSRATKGDEQ